MDKTLTQLDLEVTVKPALVTNSIYRPPAEKDCFLRLADGQF